MWVAAGSNDTLAGPATKHLAEILKTVEGLRVLTIADIGNFLPQGGMIHFQLDQGKVRFEINPDAAARARLKISPDLLELAEIVKDEQRTEAR